MLRGWFLNGFRQLYPIQCSDFGWSAWVSESRRASSFIWLERCTNEFLNLLIKLAGVYQITKIQIVRNMLSSYPDSMCIVNEGKILHFGSLPAHYCHLVQINTCLKMVLYSAVPGIWFSCVCFCLRWAMLWWYSSTHVMWQNNAICSSRMPCRALFVANFLWYSRLSSLVTPLGRLARWEAVRP